MTGVAVGSEHLVSLLIEEGHLTREPRGQPDPGAGREDDPATAREPAVENPWTKLLTKPTSEPIARAANSVSIPSSVPRDGPSGSSRVSLMSEDDTLDSRTCGKQPIDQQLVLLGDTSR